MKRLGMFGGAVIGLCALSPVYAQDAACPAAADVRWMPAVPNAGETLLLGLNLPDSGISPVQIRSVVQTEGRLEIDLLLGGFVGVPPPFHPIGRFPAGDYVVTIDVERDSAAPCPSITTALTIAPAGAPLPEPVPAPTLSWQGLLALLALCAGVGAVVVRRFA